MPNVLFFIARKQGKSFALLLCAFLFGVKKFEINPYKALEISKNRVFFKFKKELLKNSQDSKDLYYDDGSFTIFETKSYLKRKYFFSIYS